MNEIEIIKPDDWHIHFRDNDILRAVVPETTRHYSRGIIMPNLIPPILNDKDAIAYKKRINKSIPKKDDFEPFMTIYLTEETNKNILKKAFDDKIIFAAKLYPAGATTNSDSGVKKINKIMPVLQKMAEIGMPLLIHGEVTNPNIDIFDREKEFLNTTLSFIIKEIPNLKITLEHITTEESVHFIKDSSKNIAASITPHHLSLNRNAIFLGGIRPHNYCLPILKREKHQKALIDIAVTGNKKFFLGTDTAPHTISNKENACGCAGIFNATYGLPIVTQIFENENSLDNLEKFVSVNGAEHYKLRPNKTKIKLYKSVNPIKFKKYLIFDKHKILIFNPNLPVYWDVKSI